MIAVRAKLCINRYWQVVGGLSVGTTPEPHNTPPSNYCQTVADGVTLRIDRRREVVVDENAPKYSVESLPVEKFVSISAAIVPQIVGFFYFYLQSMIKVWWLTEAAVIKVVTLHCITISLSLLPAYFV